MKIFSYWEGVKPVYIQMCQDTLLKHCPDVEIISSCIEHNDLDIHYKVDYLKAKLIYNNGGFWIDADMIVMKDLTPIESLLGAYDFVGIPGFFGAKKGAPILKRWIDGMDAIINKPLTFSDLIQPLLHDPEFVEFGPIAKDAICPIYHDEFNKFFDKDDVFYGDPYIVTLYNAQFPDWFKKMTREEILTRNMTISKFFKKAL
jgi:hypothetical protein